MLTCFEKAILCHYETSVGCTAPKKDLNSFRPAGEATQRKRDAEAKHTHCNINMWLSQKDGGLEPRKSGVLPGRLHEVGGIACSVELRHFGCPVVYTFIVTSRWPNLSRVSGRQDLCSLPDIQQFFWVVTLEEKMTVYLFLFVIFWSNFKRLKVEKSGKKKLKRMDTTSGKFFIHFNIHWTLLHSFPHTTKTSLPERFPSWTNTKLICRHTLKHNSCTRKATMKFQKLRQSKLKFSETAGITFCFISLKAWI